MPWPVAVTFDDGPHPLFTNKILDIAKHFNVRFTFFVVGVRLNGHEHLIERMRDEGHEVGNHTWSHSNISKLADELFVNELRYCDEAIYKITGDRPKLFRPPYGEITKEQRCKAEQIFGYRTCLWNVDSKDWKCRDPQMVVENTLDKASKYSVILLHDIHKHTADSIPQILDELLKKNLKSTTTSHLISLINQ